LVTFFGDAEKATAGACGEVAQPHCGAFVGRLCFGGTGAAAATGGRTDLPHNVRQRSEEIFIDKHIFDITA
jgi:hypothetical protein